MRDRYGYGTEKIQGDAAPRLNQQFLIARRLVEAGARVVTLSYSFWDWHGQNFRNGKANLPDLDQAVSALVEDLHQRGLDDHVTLIVWGEFGRTPRINKDAGRDHWSNAMSVLFAGGGAPRGAVIGATDRQGYAAVERVLSPENFVSTIYRKLGINPDKILYNTEGRPTHLVSDPTVISELV